MNSVVDPETLMSQIRAPQTTTSDDASFARAAVRGLPVSGRSAPVSARGAVVNRTHRVVRERARVMQERRSRARSLLVPMVLSSVLLTLTVLAVWTGMYQYQAFEAVQADVSALAVADLNNHFLVVLLWFVPVSLALLATLWVRRSRRPLDSVEEEAL